LLQQLVENEREISQRSLDSESTQPTGGGRVGPVA
jgi:hypothetical protein